MRTATSLLIATVLIIGLSSNAVASRELTFEERVRVQEAIESVYYRHQMGTSRSFEEAVPRAALEYKVRTYLKQSVALEEFWQTPITNQALRAELARIAGNTRLPDRLKEVYAALDRDPVLILECFVRPVLVNRLSRNLFAFDERIHGTARAAAESLRDQLLRGEIDPSWERPDRAVVNYSLGDGTFMPQGFVNRQRTSRVAQEEPLAVELDPEQDRLLRRQAPEQVGQTGEIVETREEFVVRVVLSEVADHMRVASYAVAKATWDAWWPGVSNGLDETRVESVEDGDPVPLPPCVPDDTWDNGGLDDFPEGRYWHTAVWTGSLMIAWGGSGGSVAENNSGWRYDPLLDEWTPTSELNAPSGRLGHSVIWTGSEMVVWGGNFLNTGGRYNPLTDTWTQTSIFNAPSGRSDHTAVWTGSQMVVWGGNSTNTGGRYNPVADTWAPMSTVNAPTPRRNSGAVWTGSRMIVWGGYNGSFLNTGGQYDPFSDTWSPASTSNAPAGRFLHTTVWTGSQMIVWGGLAGSSTYLNTGGRYDPLTNTWTRTSTVGAPSGRLEHSAIWTGDRMVVWGGMQICCISAFDTGGRYDPISDSWTPTSAVNAPLGRARHTAVWTGGKMIVWGGFGTQTALGSGGRYDPLSDTWTPTATGDAPSPRESHTAVWTGSLMIVWGGWAGISILNTGGRYDPLIDTWSPTSSLNAPLARAYHTAVWTGERMIVWGGYRDYGTDTGGLYDPLMDTWTPTSTVNAPLARGEHTAVWTGTEMVVWGGDGSPTDPFPVTGGRYNPMNDTWRPTSTVGVPSGRWDHTALWTGSRVIMWGGYDGSTPRNGAKYDPDNDSWEPVSTAAAPMVGRGHVAAWTGSRMILWGGAETNVGGRYDPLADTWEPTSTTGAPSPRYSPAAVWTGRVMIVWGGYYGEYYDIGGRYDPLADAWTPTSSLGAASGRDRHTAVYTGSQMIVFGGHGYTSTLGSGGRYFIGLSTDEDGDGLSECDGDCNDADSGVSPGAIEICDGLDNDCNGSMDDGLGTTTCGVGVCERSVTTCVDGAPQTCTPGPPSLEVCNGVDDDCDGSQDEDMGMTTCGVGACERSVQNCVAGVQQPCLPGSASPETCNGSDDDCDGQADEDLGFGTLSVAALPERIWPPNHRMVNISPEITVSLECSAVCSSPKVWLMSVTSNEPDDAAGAGDGQTTQDIQGASLDSPDFHFSLRAERDGGGGGRVYMITYAATDCLGHSASSSAAVVVPHDQGGDTEPVILEVIGDSARPENVSLAWGSIEGAVSYNVIRAPLSATRAIGSLTMMQGADCLAREITATSLSGGLLAENPAPGEAFAYLVEFFKGAHSGYGTETSGRELIVASGDSCH